MEGNYEISYDGQSAGRADITTQGLYYRICCRCQIHDGKVCRLVAHWQDGWVSLGIPIPEGDGFSLHKKLPQKSIPVEEVHFQLIPAKLDPESILFPPKQLGPDDEEELPQISQEQQTEESVEKAPCELPLREDVPFDDLDRLEMGKLEMRGDEPYVIFSPEESASEVNDESNRAMVGAQDIRVDGSGADPVTDPV